MTSLFTPELSLLKSTGTGTNLSTFNLSTLLFKLLKLVGTFFNLSISNLSTLVLNQLNQLFSKFPFNTQFIIFSLYYFFNSKLFLICFLEFFFIKPSNNFFSFKNTNNKCPRHIVF